MPKIDYVLPCEYVSFIEPTGSITLVNLFDHLANDSLPAWVRGIHVLVRFSGEIPENFSPSFEIAKPDGIILDAAKDTELFPPRIGIVNSAWYYTARYGEFSFPEFGEYSFMVLINGIVCHTIPFKVLRLERR